jgi:hypothetical protein
VVENLTPIAMYPAYPSASYLAGLGSEEMIPPLRGLSSFVISTNDTVMSDADSILGKRGPVQNEGMSTEDPKSPDEEVDSVGECKLKKGRLDLKRSGSGGARNVLEATSLGAAGQLTGLHGAARQGQ